VVRTEIATIIQLGHPIKNQQGKEIDNDLRRRINVVNADVSPDLRQARITISVMKRNNLRDEEDEDGYDDEEEYEEEEGEEEGGEYDEDDEYDDEDEDEEINVKSVFPDTYSRNSDSVVDRRQSYAWLVRNTKQIRHAMSQRLSHMKTIPNLTFILADVGAAVDVMNLIDKVSKGNYKRDDIGLFGGDNDNLPSNMYLESELEDEYEWIDDEEEEEWVDNDEETGEKDAAVNEKN
jgi:ribosome-binding factor A